MLQSEETKELLMRVVTLVRILLLLALVLSGLGCDNNTQLVITTDTLPNGTVGSDYSFTLEVDGDADDFLIVDGDLPPGISLSDSGELFGTPTVAGQFLFTIEALDLFDGFIDQRTSKGFALVVTE